MKRFFKLIFLGGAIIASFAACSNSNKEDDEPDPEPEPEPTVTVVDLSKDEMANCYIVQEPGLYKFAADNRFNLGEGLPVPPQIHPADAVLVWQSEKGSVSDIKLETEDGHPYVTFEVNEAKGNALIAVVDENGAIEWSWHIWMPVVEISSVESGSGYQVMNLNLGALNNETGDLNSYGLLYQWGRKDPFPSSPTLTGTTSTLPSPVYNAGNQEVEISNSSWFDTEANSIEYAISHPTVVISNYAQYATSRDWLLASDSNDALWGNPEGDKRGEGADYLPNKGQKTCYDPSPAGWRVPPADVFNDFTTSGGYAWDFMDFNVADINSDGIISLDDYKYGWTFMMNGGNTLYFPAAARYDGSYAMLMGSVSGIWGNYWSNSPYSDMAGGAFCALAFQVQDQTGTEMVTISASAAASRADAFSIRCIRDN